VIRNFITIPRAFDILTSCGADGFDMQRDKRNKPRIKFMAVKVYIEVMIVAQKILFEINHFYGKSIFIVRRLISYPALGMSIYSCCKGGRLSEQPYFLFPVCELFP